MLYGCVESDLSYKFYASGFNTASISVLTAFHKISLSNMNNDYSTIESITRYFRMNINYSPYNFLLKELLVGIYLCIYNSFASSYINGINLLVDSGRTSI